MPAREPPDAGLPGGAAAGAAIVIPVFGAAGALDRCLAALADGTDLARHPVALVLDGPQPADLESTIERRAGSLGALEVLRSPARRGFPAMANRGIAHCAGRDVALLNSDVQVTSGWLDRLTVAARSHPRIASVTPLTNHGTLASVPRWFEENALPAGHTLASFAALVERISRRRYPEIPTGVGFCLYLRRTALDEVGTFDEAAFDLGYGEEVDWCQRALARGYEHRIDDATYVWHEGGASFGGAGDARRRRAQRLLRRRHPGYEASLTRFTEQNPLAEIHREIAAALAPPRRSSPGGRRLRLAHVVHGWPPWNHAGTETYARRLVGELSLHHDQVVYGRYAPADRPFGHALEVVDGGTRVRLVANRFLQRDPFVRNALHSSRLCRDFGDLLDETKPHLVHVHHLAGHCLTLPREAARRGIPIVFQLQDWWAACARANLLDADRRLCPGPRPRRCQACLAATRRPPAGLWGPLLYALRFSLARRALALADAFVAGSGGVVEDHRRLGLLPPGVPVRICDYGAPASPARTPRAREESSPIRLGFVGSLAPHKGLHVAAAALARQERGRFVLEVWGEPRTGPYVEEVRDAAGDAEIRFLEPFPDDERDRVLGGLDLLLAPSLGLESYGLAVAEALAAGTPALVSDRGALPERVVSGGGVVVPAGDVAAWARALESIAREPGALRRLREGLCAPVEFTRHVAEIESAYEKLGGAGGRA